MCVLRSIGKSMEAKVAEHEIWAGRTTGTIWCWPAGGAIVRGWICEKWETGNITFWCGESVS